MASITDNFNFDVFWDRRFQPAGNLGPSAIARSSCCVAVVSISTQEILRRTFLPSCTVKVHEEQGIGVSQVAGTANASSWVSRFTFQMVRLFGF